jgi:hypothetical protein
MCDLNGDLSSSFGTDAFCENDTDLVSNEILHLFVAASPPTKHLCNNVFVLSDRNNLLTEWSQMSFKTCRTGSKK